MLLSLFGLGLLGCKTDPHATREIALLRSEILDLEDQYYALKSQYRYVMENLRDSHGDNSASDPYLNDGPVLYGPGMPYCDDPNLSYGNETIIEHGSVIPQYREPRISPQREELPPPRQTQPDSNQSGESSDDQGGNWDSGNGILLEGSEITGQFRRASTVMEVASVSINESATRGEDLDGVPGDEGLVLLVQPRSDSGNVIQTTGDLTVSIVDPREPFNRQTLGTWQFSAAEVPNFFVREELIQQGILLHLPWSSEVPRHRNVIVNVQFSDSTQREHVSSCDVDIVPPPENYTPDETLIAEWLENDSRWVDLATGTSVPDERTGSVPTPVQRSGRSTPRWRPVR
ncbi:MAG: hypothetical protein MK108_08580 [Mariniblastus sp.]|nr:hypothetical protein [Mariniblastus sp.]